MQTDIKETSLPWKYIANMWKTYFTSPSRISPQELGKYKEWMKRLNPNKKPLKALVLGATPELRDALTELGIKLYSIDINMDIFLAMDELLRNKDPNEVLIKANWLDNPLADSYFDIVAGDAVLPNVPWQERTHLLSEVRRLLTPKGFFLTRAFCVPDKKPFADISEILNHFSKKKPTMQAALEMVLELQILTYDPKDHLGSFAKAKAVLERYHREKGSIFINENIQKIHDIVWDFWCVKFIGKVFVYAYGKEEVADYKKHFSINEIFQAKDHDYTNITPMFLLKRL